MLKGHTELIQKLKKLSYVKKTVAKTAGREAVLFFKDRFRAQDWTDTRTQPWKKRKVTTKSNRGRNLLLKTGNLRRSIRITRSTANMVWVGTDIPYARAHNYGFRGTQNVKKHKRSKFSHKQVGTGVYKISSRTEKTKKVSKVASTYEVEAHTRRVNIPKRQFIGASHVLADKIMRQIMLDIKKAMR